MKKIVFNFMFFLLLSSACLRASENDNRELVKGIFLQYKDIMNFDIEFMIFQKNDIATTEETNVINNMLKPEVFNAVRDKLSEDTRKPLTTKDINIVAESDKISFDFCKMIKTRENKKYMKKLLFKNNSPSGGGQYFIKDQTAYINNLIDGDWQITNNVAMVDRDIELNNPLNCIGDYFSGATSDGRYISENIYDLFSETKEISSSIKDNIFTMELNKPDNVKVEIKSDLNKSEIIEIKVLDQFQSGYSLLLSNYFEIKGLKIPKKLNKIYHDSNNKTISEINYILSNLKVNDESINFNFSEDNIKNKSLVIDERNDFIYYKGHPELRP